MVVKVTQAQRVNSIAQELGLPVSVVKRVVDGYVESLQKSALGGEDVEVRGLFRIKVKSIDGHLVPRGIVSEALKEKFRLEELKVEAHNVVQNT